ncbi:MAG: site-specific integrase [Rhodospirillaceae bacterium]
MTLIPISKGWKIAGTECLIRKRPDSKNLEVCIWFKDFKKYKVFSSKTTDISIAENFAQQKMWELKYMEKQGIAIFSDKFTDILNEWLSTYKTGIETGHKTLHMYCLYESIVRVHMMKYFKNVSIGSMNKAHIDGYVQYLINGTVKSESTMKTHKAVIALVFKYAIEKGYYKKSAPEFNAPSAKTQKTQNRGAFRSDEMVEIVSNLDRFIESSQNEIRLYNSRILKIIIHFMNGTGCRTNDLQLVKWSDFSIKYNDKKKNLTPIGNEGNGAIAYLEQFMKDTGKNPLTWAQASLYVFLKGKSIERTIPLDDELIPFIIEWHKHSKHTNPTDLVFAGFNGKFNAAYSAWFKDYLTFINVPDKSDDGDRSPYSLRHTFITTKLFDGIDAVVIAKQCGTSLQHIDQTYSHFLPEDIKEKLFGNNVK